MTIDELNAEFPKWPIKNDPDPDCKVCQGEGVREKKIACDVFKFKQYRYPCICTCMDSGGGDMAKMLSDWAKQQLKKMNDDRKTS